MSSSGVDTPFESIDSSGSVQYSVNPNDLQCLDAALENWNAGINPGAATTWPDLSSESLIAVDDQAFYETFINYDGLERELAEEDTAIAAEAEQELEQLRSPATLDFTNFSNAEITRMAGLSRQMIENFGDGGFSYDTFSTAGEVLDESFSFFTEGA